MIVIIRQRVRPEVAGPMTGPSGRSSNLNGRGFTTAPATTGPPAFAGTTMPTAPFTVVRSRCLIGLNPRISMPTVDTERFRLRNFIDRLVENGECEVHDKPIDLVDVGGVLEGNPKAVLFKAAGPEKAELVGNVMASRKRIAMALDTDERNLLGTLAQRLNTLHPPVKVSSQQAPVQQVVLKDDTADLCALPAHLQHAADGAPYIS